MRGLVGGAWVALVLGGLGGCDPGPPRPPSVVLISFDTTRADRLGAYGNTDGLTPNLDRFAAESIVFEHAYAQATLTTQSHTSLFTSRYPSELFGREKTPHLTGATPLLAEVLASYGFATGAFVGGGDLSPEFGLDRGFGTYLSPREFGSFWFTVPPALAWLDGLDPEQPFFAFIHGYDAHARYLKPAPFGYLYADPHAEGPGQEAVRTRTERIIDGRLLPDTSPLQEAVSTLLRPRSPEGRALVAAAADRVGAPVFRDEDAALIGHVYDGAVSYADAMFGLLMAGLQERGILDEAIVVVVSDHGEQLGEQGLYFRYCGVGEEDARVPLLVRMPGGAGGGRRVEGLAQLIDVMPTLLELIGAAAPAGTRGASLVPALRGEAFPGAQAAFTQGGVSIRWVSAGALDGRVTYVGVAPWASALPDMVETAQLPGPGFTVSADTTSAAQARLRGDLVAWLRTLTPAPGQGPASLSPALRQSLREHGYFDAGAP